MPASVYHHCLVLYCLVFTTGVLRCRLDGTVATALQLTLVLELNDAIHRAGEISL